MNDDIRKRPSYSRRKPCNLACITHSDCPLPCSLKPLPPKFHANTILPPLDAELAVTHTPVEHLSKLPTLCERGNFHRSQVGVEQGQ